MSKPWDHLRREPINPLPIEKDGEIDLAGGAKLHLSRGSFPRLRILSGSRPDSAEFCPKALRQLAELATELADQHGDRSQ